VRDQRFGNRQPLPPTSGKRLRSRFEIPEPGASECFTRALLTFAARDACSIQGALNYRADCLARCKFRMLPGVTYPCIFAHRQRALIWLPPPGKNFEQRRLPGTIRPDQAQSIAFENSER
jgi:hypothetical protein